MSKLQGLGVQVDSDGHGSGMGKVPCWAFATFDGHAGPACAHYLKENFMVRVPLQHIPLSSKSFWSLIEIVSWTRKRGCGSSE